MDGHTLGSTASGEITRLLTVVRRGDGAMHRLMALVCDELHAMARRQLRCRQPRQALTSIAQALTSLAALDGRLSTELQIFAKLIEEKAVQVTGTSEHPVRRDWRRARAFLHQALGGSLAA